MGFWLSLGKGLLGSKRLSKIATNKMCGVTTSRPRAFSLWSHIDKPVDKPGPVGEFTTWPMLTDRLFSARHLPPASQNYIDNLPFDTPYKKDDAGNVTMGNVTRLFAREGAMKEDRSSVLFMFFAQWFTDSILRIDPKDRRKNTSNHNIDLCQIYGLKETTTNLLRTKEGGKLKSQKIDGEEYPDYLREKGADGTWRVKDEYKGLPYASDDMMKVVFKDWSEERLEKVYATGLERGNSSVGYVAISTLFLREHNRICDELADLDLGWDADTLDERLFQTARMINIVILMKLVVQDYINHIAGNNIFMFDPTFAEKEDWYRTPWISLEFDLLYRWHGLVPDELKIGDQTYPDEQYRHNNGLLETAGINAIISGASTQNAGKISLKNVPDFLYGAEYQTIKMGRDFRLQPYNEYRKKFGLKPIKSFRKLTDDSSLRSTLETLYGDIDQVEYIVGLFAEKSDDDRLYGDLMYAMVAYDAFTQIYTNPLLSKSVYTSETYTHYGLDLIEETNSVQDLVARNTTDAVIAEFSL